MDQLSALPWKSRSPLPSIEHDETLLKSSHRHFFRFLLPIAFYVFLLLGVVLAFVFGSALGSGFEGVAQTVFLVGLVATLGLQHWFFHWMLSESMYDIILTNERILYLTHYFWFTDSMYEIALKEIKAVEVKKHGALQYLFDYGELWFDTGGSSDQSRSIAYVPHPRAWENAIAEARIKEA